MDELITAPAPAKKGVGIGVLVGVVVLAVAASSGVAFFLVQWLQHRVLHRQHGRPGRPVGGFAFQQDAHLEDFDDVLCLYAHYYGTTIGVLFHETVLD